MKLTMHDGQRAAWQSDRRFVAVLAGTQGGKTSFGPHWLYREIQRKGPGDYLVVTPTFPLLELKLLPTFRVVFERVLRLGDYVGSPSRKFIFSADGAQRAFGDRRERFVETRVLFGHAGDPESLESATAKAAWLDEAGQKQFKLGAWEAILRRLALYVGRVLITTSIYALGWLKEKIFDHFHAGDPSIDVINFPSTENPQYPLAEFERARRDLPHWKFKMQYLGQFDRPAGMIYDCFDPVAHVVPRFALPADWPRYLGVDFGQQNTAATWWAEEPQTNRLYCYRTYHRGGVSAATHVRFLLHGERGLPLRCVGGSASETAWRQEFAAAGLPVRAPRTGDVDLGIDRVYGAIQRGEILIFADLPELKEQLTSYSRVLDANGAPTEAIEDKASYHLLDAMRYIVGDLRAAARAAKPAAGVTDWYGAGSRGAGNRQQASGIKQRATGKGQQVIGNEHPDASSRMPDACRVIRRARSDADIERLLSAEGMGR